VVPNFIDIWDAKTFDRGLTAILINASDLIRSYLRTESRIFLEHDRGRGPQTSIIRPTNPYAPAFLSLKETMREQMQTRTMRAWHYTRLTTKEMANMLEEGIHLSTPATLRSRLDSLVASDVLGVECADALYAQSPFHGDQLEARSGRFCMASHPVTISDSGVQRFLAHWGGEVASFWMKDPANLAVLTATGKPRVLEIAVPLDLTAQSHSAAGAVVATFGQELGCVVHQHSFDVFVTTALSPDSVLRVHTEGDSSFTALGISYPAGYVDADIGYWKRLTGEDF
jgi:hypothetical protein